LDLLEHKVDLLKDLEVQVDQVFIGDLTLLKQDDIVSLDDLFKVFEYFP